MGHFSHAGLGSKVSHSDGTSHLNEMSHLIKTSYQKEKVINLTMQDSNGKWASEINIFLSLCPKKNKQTNKQTKKKTKLRNFYISVR